MRLFTRLCAGLFLALPTGAAIAQVSDRLPERGVITEDVPAIVVPKRLPSGGPYLISPTSTDAVVAIAEGSRRRSGDLATLTVQFRRAEVPADGSLFVRQDHGLVFDCAARRVSKPTILIYDVWGEIVEERAGPDWQPLNGASPLLDMACDGRRPAGWEVVDDLERYVLTRPGN